jgi:hypothetical protein
MASETKEVREFDEIDFDIDAVSGVSSTENVRASRPDRAATVEVLDSEVIGSENRSPVFKLLSNPILPELKHEPRARLMMQSPTRLYFYWSVGHGSYEALRNGIGDLAGYILAFRLLNISRGSEEVHAVDPEGSWWFEAEPNTEYKAEVGFYSVSRPFVRILFSNTIATPRKSPSPRSSNESQWAVTTHEFAQVLDASGFEEDAYDVIGAGTAEGLSTALSKHLGMTSDDISRFEDSELRRALDALAGGSTLEDLKWKITAELYALLEKHIEKLSVSRIRNDLQIMGGSAREDIESFTSIGGSLVRIPRPRFRPISSINIP